MSTPTPEQFYNKRGQDRTKPDIAFLKNHFYREGRLTEDQALWIIEQGTDVLKREPNVLEVEAPITGTIPVFIAASKAQYETGSSLRRHTWTICKLPLLAGTTHRLMIAFNNSV